MDSFLQDTRYFYVVHGSIPELMPGVAYRRTDRTRERDRKTLKCPYCEKRLTDTDADTHVELYRYPVRVRVPCHFYMKCLSCGAEIGINIA